MSGGPVRRPAGFTLLELLVTLVILTITLGVSALAFARDGAPGAPDRARATVSAARSLAIATGKPVRARAASPRVAHSGDGADSVRSLHLTALPDGRVIAPAELGIDHSSGRPRSGVIP